MVEEVRTKTAGLVRSVNVEPGARVRAGDLLFTMEVMKMDVPYQAPRDGVVKEVHVAEGGDGLEAGVLAVVIE